MDGPALAAEASGSKPELESGAARLWGVRDHWLPGWAFPDKSWGRSPSERPWQVRS